MLLFGPGFCVIHTGLLLQYQAASNYTHLISGSLPAARILELRVVQRRRLYEMRVATHTFLFLHLVH